MGPLGPMGLMGPMGPVGTMGPMGPMEQPPLSLSSSPEGDPPPSMKDRVLFHVREDLTDPPHERILSQTHENSGS